MTQVNTDDELRKQIGYIINGYAYAKQRDLPIAIDNAMQLIQADRKKHELQARIDTATDILFGFSRTYEQKVTDSAGKVYVDDSHSYISKYEVQELVSKLKAELDKL